MISSDIRCNILRHMFYKSFYNCYNYIPVVGLAVGDAEVGLSVGLGDGKRVGAREGVDVEGRYVGWALTVGLAVGD